MSFGAGVGTGVGIGCGAYAIGGVVVFATLGIIGSVLGWLWPFVIIAAVAIVMMFFPRTRAIATGILIVSAAAWLTVIGPCLLLVTGMTP